MKIYFKDILLRDYIESDIEDHIRWMTNETAWQNWDAPWEAENDIENFNSKEYSDKMLDMLSKPVDEYKPRKNFQLCLKDGTHIGLVNSYFVDNDFNWLPSSPDKPCLLTIDSDICESSYWGNGYGSQAYVAFINYFLNNNISVIYTQTWSGNERMIAMAKKVGFQECNRKIGAVLVHNQAYDNITFKLNLNKFESFKNKI